MPEANNTNKRILKIAIFRALFLGDMLCIIPSVRAIRKAHPEAAITMVGLPWQKEFAARFSHYFDHFIEFPGWPGLPEQEPDTDRIFLFLRHIRRHKFDVVFQMQGNGMITNTMCMLWGGGKVYGLQSPDTHGLNKNMFPVSDDGENEITRFFKLLAAAGISPDGTALEFPLRNREVSAVIRITSALGIIPQNYICLHPGARDKRRRWPVENFSAIGNRLCDMGYQLVLTGSQQERALLRELENQIHKPVVNLVENCGHLGIGELAGIINNAALLISNDTGISHIAAALKVPSVIIFSPYSDLNRWSPLDTSRHIAIPFDQTGDPELIYYRVMDHLMKQRSPLVVRSGAY